MGKWRSEWRGGGRVCGGRVVRSLKGSCFGGRGRLGWVTGTLDAVGAEVLKDALEMMSANWLDS